MLKYQCSACGAPLRFDAEKQLLVCDSCESEFAQDFIEQQAGGGAPAAEQAPSLVDWKTQGYVAAQETLADQPGFVCESCGAEIVSDGHTAATECMYCGNPVVLSDRVAGMVKPDMVLPFKITKEEAERKLRNFYEGKPLLPNAFKSGNRISKIAGLYVPFWLFSCTGTGSATFNATKVRRWSDSNYNYTKTSYYEVDRAGSMAFASIPVDASTKMEDNYMDGVEPYDYKELAGFEPMYLAGYFADRYDVGVEESSERATRRVIASVEDALEDTVEGYTTVSRQHSYVNMVGEDIRYALLPVWMLNTKYNGEMYQFAINGQTGQVAGKLPIDKTKLWLWRLGITVLSAIPATIIVSWLLS